MQPRDRALTKAIAGAMNERFAKVAEAFAKHLAARQALEARVAALESGGNLAEQYQGTFDADRSYERGQVVTHGGSLWLVLRDVTGEKPGPSTAYRLILKGRS
jgi:hypothetical protein